jgi:hypothetical protein
VSLQLHRPDGKGSLEPRTVHDRDWRRGLRSPRWGSARPGGKLPELRNPEMNPMSPWISVLFWISLAALTFVVIVVGYGTGFWE